jgi:prevent-host-death family protein
MCQFEIHRLVTEISIGPLRRPEKWSKFRPYLRARLEVRDMKNLHVSEDILPVGEFKTHASQVIRRLQATKRPFVITQNGRPAAVLITPAEFDRLSEHAHFLEAVDEGLSDFSAGRIWDDESLNEELKEAFGPLEQ